MKKTINLIKTIKTIILSIIMYIYAYLLVIKLCCNPKYKKVRMPKILIKKYINKNLGGETTGRGVIYLNFYKNTDLNILKKNIYHEFRHMWQRAYLPDDFLWWILFHYDIYYYSTIEMDARRFANSLGKKDDELIFSLISPETLDQYLIHGSLDLLLYEAFLYLIEKGECVDQ